MTNKLKSRLDAMLLALGGVSLAGAFGVLPFGALPIVTNDRINVAVDKKIRERSAGACPDAEPDSANASWAE